ncbi:MAG: Mu-like prophage major head subunit gpT family protein [Verrucomicrobiota bacterium]
MGDGVMVEEFPDGDQRLAVCNRQWADAASDKAKAEAVIQIKAAPSTGSGQADTPAESARVTGVAYSGGKMTLPGWRHPVVVDLTGLELPESVPLLTNHENRTGNRVGVVRASVEGNALLIDGEILSSSAQAKGIVEQARSGADWQLSIGAEVHDSELVRGKRTVNGQLHVGPFYHVKRATLREVSVVAVGADVGTRMKLAATFNLYGGSDMEFEKWLEEHGINAEGLDEEKLAALKAAFEAGEEPPTFEKEADPPKPEKPKDEAPPVQAKKETAPPTTVAATGAPDTTVAKEEAEGAVRAERERVAAIQEVCGGEFPKIEREAVRGGWSVEDTSQKVLKAMRADRPQADVGMSVGGRGRALEGRTLEAALCLRAGIDEEALVKDYGDQIVEGAVRERDLSLQQLLVECAAMEGVSVPRSFCNDTIRAAFSTVSLPGILNNVANKRLLKSFQAQPVTATKLCSEGELNDFKESERYRLTDVGDLEPVAPDGELKHGGLKEDKATNRLGTFGKTFTLTRQMIYNDDLGAFLKVPDGMGARAAKKIDQLFFTRLLSNPNSLFSTAHKNYKAGATTALSADSLALAVQMFLDQVDADGQPINISPKFLVVPTPLKMLARQLLNSVMLMAVGSTDKQNIPTYNALADEDLEVVASPYLSNTNYDGASEKAWYLFADPAVVDTFEIGYLKGRRTPTVEQGEVDFNNLGIWFRVYFDLGVREQDFRGMCKFKGEA